jgi:hypothetical protein
MTFLDVDLVDTLLSWKTVSKGRGRQIRPFCEIMLVDSLLNAPATEEGI